MRRSPPAAGPHRPRGSPPTTFPPTADAPDPRLRAALDRLRPIDREALLLTAWEGLSTERAARAAGCSRATFHVRLHRARKRLAQALESETR